MTSIRIAVGVVLIFTIGCDSFTMINELDFMPLEVGNSWSYEYAHHGFDTSSNPDSVVGYLTWTVMSHEKNGRDRVYTVHESFDGFLHEQVWNQDSEEWHWTERAPHSWEREIKMIETSSGVRLELPSEPRTAPYLFKVGNYSSSEPISWSDTPVARYYATSADTVNGVGKENYLVYNQRWTLVKNRGIVKFKISQDSPRAKGLYEWSLTLVDSNLATR